MRTTLIAAFFACSGVVVAAEVAVASPDGRVEFHLVDAPGGLQYTALFGGKPVIEPPALGILVDSIDLSKGVALGKAERYRFDETYPWNGPHSTAADRCNGLKVSAVHKQSHLAFTIEMRAYNDGIAFRHVVPGTGVRVPDEATTFRPVEGSTLWYHDLEGHYEGAYTRKGIRAVPPGAWLAPPVTFRLPEGAGYASITEGGLRAYSGMGLQADENGTLHARLGHSIPASYPFRLRYAADVQRLTKPASIEGGILTPWRIVMIGADLNALVNCDIVHNVAAPPDPNLFPEGARTPWVKPGRSLWSYLDGGNHTPEAVKEWARLASQLGFEYNLLEGYWSRWPESQLKEVADYSRQQGIGLIIWKHSNQLRTAANRRDFFDMCKRTGVAGAKIDFFDHEHKEVVELYEELLKGAAERRLLIDFHGCNKPTGLERTYPNLLGQEGIKGMETQPPFAQQEVIFPFTRMLAGLADYTPMHFGGTKLADTTWTHQVANAILLQAPLLVLAAHPANILANPALDVIKAIPATWDETIALPISQIGEVAAFARRKGDTWFLAVNNGAVGRSVQIDLSFLGEGSYHGTLLRDRCEADDVKIEHLTVQRSGPLYCRMRSGGGFIARFARM